MKLTAWRRADDLASAVFHTTERLDPRHRWLGLQLVRAAISVPANIAEGYGSGYTREYLRFVDIARRSLTEVEYYLHFLKKEGLVQVNEIDDLMRLRMETGRTLHGLWNGLKIKTKSAIDLSTEPSRIREVTTDLYEVEA